MIKGRDTGTIVLLYSDSNRHIVRDTAFLNMGRFQFSGKINQPTFCWLIAKGDNNKGNFFLEPTKQQVFMEENKYSEMKMTGSYTEAQDDTLMNQIKIIQSKYSNWTSKSDSLTKELRNAPDSLTQLVLQNELLKVSEKLKIMNKETLTKTVEFIAAHPNSYASPTLLYGILINNSLSTDSISIIYNNLNNNIKNSIAGKLINNEVNKRMINMQVPDFTALDINNKKKSLDQYRGKYVLLNFWASWCRPCIKKIPELKHLINSYKSKGFEIINISIDTDKQKWLSSVQKYNLNDFSNVLANEEITDKFTNIREPIPSEILVSPSGSAIWNSMNSNDKSLEETLKAAFKN